MSRLFVLIPLVIWLMRPVAGTPVDWQRAALATAVLVAGLILIPAAATATNLRTVRLERSRRFGSRFPQRLRQQGPLILAAWFGVCTYWLGWNDAVITLRQFLREPLAEGFPQITLIETSLAVAPAYMAWGVLLLADWPLVRNRRERRMLTEIELGRDPTPLPHAGRWWLSVLRLRLLFVLVPLAAFFAAKDLAAVGLWWSNPDLSEEIRAMILLVAGLVLMVTVAPWLIVRTLPTRPLPPGPGSDRLRAFAARCGLRPSELRMWDTDGSTANALAIGFLPRMRYVLVSDLLLTGLSVPQVEAVVAHEAGHVRHRHMAWFLIFFLALSLLLIGPVDGTLRYLLDGQRLPGWLDWSLSGAILAGIVMLFGVLSRLFERQADVFAARTVQQQMHPLQDPPLPSASTRLGPVRVEGAWLFAGALENAIRLNGHSTRPPVRRPGLIGWATWLLSQTGSFLHGSPRTRAMHLARLAEWPHRTSRFDAGVRRIKATILAIAVVSLAFLLM